MCCRTHAPRAKALTNQVLRLSLIEVTFAFPFTLTQPTLPVTHVYLFNDFASRCVHFSMSHAWSGTERADRWSSVVEVWGKCAAPAWEVLNLDGL